MPSPPLPVPIEPVPIDPAAWPRREQFEHYRHRVSCSYAITVEIDVTAFAAVLADSTRKTYPAQIWALTTVVNRHPEFRMTLTADGEPAVWPAVRPAFTVFNPERETFACVWTVHHADFADFHDAVTEVLATHRHATTMFPLGPPPADCFDVSSLPWTSFTGFSLQLRDGWDHLAPIVTLGRYVERDGRLLLPVSVQIHHAAADGFHTSRLIEDLRRLMAEPDWIG